LKKTLLSVLGVCILTAWKRIYNESFVTGFKKCCISDVLDSNEDDFLWQDED
jgi:hypothetical protein